MNDAVPTRIPALLVTLTLSASLAACSGSSPDPTAQVSLPTAPPLAGDGEGAAASRIEAVGLATTADERGEAIKEIVRQGLTLGLLDEAGNQVNPNVPEDSLSLRPEDVAAHASLIPGSHYRTIGYVVESLAGSGVTLDSTDETIALDRFLPDLQEYVDWSFSNPDDPRSTLGLLVGAGHELRVPASVPTLGGDTLISPLASSMMAADILLGVGGDDRRGGDDLVSSVGSLFVGEARASAEEGTFQAIKGLLTTIKPVASHLAGLLPSDAWRAHATTVWASLEAGNRFAVRLIGPDGSGSLEVDKEGGSLQTWRGSKSIVLDTIGKVENVGAVITLVPEAKVNPRVQASYVLSLLSPGQRLGLPLYADADAELTSSPRPMPGPMASVGHDGYRVEMDHLYCVAGIKATRLAGQPRFALLHAAATIDAALDDLDPKALMVLTIANIDIGDLEDYIGKIQPTPWVTVVELRALPGLKCGKETFSPEAGGGVSFDGCRLNNLPHGAGRYYYENGSIQSDCVYDSGELDGLCTTYYRDPANAQQCEASYVDGDLEWEKCYFSDGAKQSVVEFTDDSGVGRVFHRSGRLDSECHYSSDGPITCERFCDNDAGTPCGKTTTDEHGEVVDEWDECSMACQ